MRSATITTTREQTAKSILRQQHRRRKALADAVAGVVASLVALWTFYPIDVIKTNIQAGGNKKKKGSSSSQLRELFRGLEMKTLSTATSGFTFFYVYSWIISWWKASAGRKDVQLSTLSRLALSALAAMCNVCITFPLDVIGTQHQTNFTSNKRRRRRRIPTSPTTTTPPEEPIPSESLLEQAWHYAAAEMSDGSSNPSARCYDDVDQDEEIFFDSVSDGLSHTELLKFEPPTRSATTTTTTDDDENEEEEDDSAHHDTEQDSVISLHPLQRVSCFWKGLCPAILLCSNPSIHYTVFDVLKSRWLAGSSNKDKLSMKQAFVLGLLAKFTATICTYPLIRAKIMLMTTSSSSDSLLGCLIREYRHGGGIKAWFRGIDLQLIHTVLKSALLMMVREGITTTTYRLLLPTRRSGTAADAN